MKKRKREKKRRGDLAIDRGGADAIGTKEKERSKGEKEKESERQDK